VCLSGFLWRPCCCWSSSVVGFMGIPAHGNFLKEYLILQKTDLLPNKKM
jgi:hypothetical protein